MVWVSLKPLPGEVTKLMQHFLEMAKLPKEEVMIETKRWMAEGLVARSLGQKVSADMVAHEFQQQAGLKDEMAAFNLEQGFLLFRFQEAGERAIVLGQP